MHTCHSLNSDVDIRPFTATIGPRRQILGQLTRLLRQTTARGKGALTQLRGRGLDHYLLVLLIACASLLLIAWFH